MSPHFEVSITAERERAKKRGIFSHCLEPSSGPRPCHRCDSFLPFRPEAEEAVVVADCRRAEVPLLRIRFFSPVRRGTVYSRFFCPPIFFSDLLRSLLVVSEFARALTKLCCLPSWRGRTRTGPRQRLACMMIMFKTYPQLNSNLSHKLGPVRLGRCLFWFHPCLSFAAVPARSMIHGPPGGGGSGGQPPGRLAS